MSEPVMRIRAMRRAFKSGEKELVILDGVDLDLRAGEIVGLVGPSGSGKSSLLHAAGLLERPNSGEVWIDGESAWELNDGQRSAIRRRALGFVYQFHHLLAEFSALDNVALPLLISGRSSRKARDEAERLLDIMGLSERLKHQPAQLSGGEQQRVAIARALANGPHILLADEPTGNLDPHTAEAVYGGLVDLVRAQGVAALIATHNMDLARKTDRLVALQDGKLVERAPA